VAVVVHDVVDLYLQEKTPEMAAAVANIERLVAAARDAKVPVIFMAPGRGDPDVGPDRREPRVVWGNADLDVPPSLGPLPGDTVIRKPRWGAFYGSALTEHLRATGRDTVIVCGISLTGGVETTVRDAYNRDLRSILVADACRCRAVADQGWGAFTSEEVARVTLSVLARFARVVDTARVCAELRNGGTYA
jgi:nicotinamidase-related amidase